MPYAARASTTNQNGDIPSPLPSLAACCPLRAAYGLQIMSGMLEPHLLTERRSTICMCPYARNCEVPALSNPCRRFRLARSVGETVGFRWLEGGLCARGARAVGCGLCAAERGLWALGWGCGL